MPAPFGRTRTPDLSVNGLLQSLCRHHRNSLSLSRGRQGPGHQALGPVWTLDRGSHGRRDLSLHRPAPCIEITIDTAHPRHTYCAHSEAPVRSPVRCAPAAGGTRESEATCRGCYWAWQMDHVAIGRRWQALGCRDRPQLGVAGRTEEGRGAIERNNQTTHQAARPPRACRVHQISHRRCSSPAFSQPLYRRSTREPGQEIPTRQAPTRHLHGIYTAPGRLKSVWDVHLGGGRSQDYQDTAGSARNTSSTESVGRAVWRAVHTNSVRRAVLGMKGSVEYGEQYGERVHTGYGA
jgi:hypothetical protein